MRARGFTVVELVLVTCIISILLAIVTLQFSEYVKRYRSESQTRMIYSLLQKARADALYQRRGTRVKLYTNRFDIYSSACENCEDAAPVQTQSLEFPLTSNATGNGADGYSLCFDSRGVANVECSICVGDRASTGGVDSVIVSRLRLSIGKRNEGDVCDKDNITVR